MKKILIPIFLTIIGWGLFIYGLTATLIGHYPWQRFLLHFICGFAGTYVALRVHSWWKSTRSHPAFIRKGDVYYCMHPDIRDNATVVDPFVGPWVCVEHNGKFFFAYPDELCK